MKEKTEKNEIKLCLKIIYKNKIIVFILYLVIINKI